MEKQRKYSLHHDRTESSTTTGAAVTSAAYSSFHPQPLLSTPQAAQQNGSSNSIGSSNNSSSCNSNSSAADTSLWRRPRDSPPPLPDSSPPMSPTDDLGDLKRTHCYSKPLQESHFPARKGFGVSSLTGAAGFDRGRGAQTSLGYSYSSSSTVSVQSNSPYYSRDSRLSSDLYGANTQQQFVRQPYVISNSSHYNNDGKLSRRHDYTNTNSNYNNIYTPPKDTNEGDMKASGQVPPSSASRLYQNYIPPSQRESFGVENARLLESRLHNSRTTDFCDDAVQEPLAMDSMLLKESESNPFFQSRKPSYGESIKTRTSSGDTPFETAIELSIRNDSQRVSSSGERSCRPPSTTVCTALYDYEAKGDDELSLVRGDILEVLSRDAKISGDEGWWTGKINGKVSLL